MESQQKFSRLETLLEIPAIIRFVSAEPLLGPIIIGERIHRIDWMITGCELAALHQRRHMDQVLIVSIRDQCRSANVPLFHKQYYQGNQLIHDVHDGLIDGEDYQQFPTPSQPV